MDKTNQIAKKGIGLKGRRFIAYFVLIFLTVLCLFWFYILIINATRSNSAMSRGFTPIPGKYLSTNWKNLLEGTLPIWTGLFNSVFIATLSAVFSVYVSAMTAYSIHTYDYKFKNGIYTFILMIMMIPTQVTSLGFLQLINKMGLDDSFIPLIAQTIATPITFFYIKQYMQSNLPLSIIEAARIDGSNEFKTFNNIVLPLVKPALAVQLIFNFVTSWNNYFVPALVLHSEEKKTLPILIAQLRSADFLRFDMGQVYVMIAFSILPVVVVYVLLSKLIIQGVTLGGVKG